MGGHTFRVYHEEDYYEKSPKIVRCSVAEINNRSQENGFNVVVFPEREQTTQYFMIEYVLSKIISGRLGNVEPLSNCKVGSKLRIGTRAINGSDDAAIVEFGGINEDVCDDPRICICVPNGRTKSLLREYIPLRYAHLFQKVDTGKPLTNFTKYSRIKKVVSSDESNLQRLANLRSYLTHSVLCVVPSLRVATKLTSEFKIDGFDLSACLLVGAVTEDGVKTISRGQIDGIPSLLVCTDIVTALGYVEQNSDVIESVIVDAASIEKALTGGALYRLQELCPNITIVSDFSGAEGIEELKDFGFSTLTWDRERLADIYTAYDGVICDRVTRWGVNFMTSSLEVVSVDDNDIELAYRFSRKLMISDDSADPVLVESYVRLNRYLFTLLRATLQIPSAELATMDAGIHDAISMLKANRRFISDETIAAYERWSELLLCLLEKKRNSKSEAFMKIVREAGGRRIILVIDDHANCPDSCKGVEIVRRGEFQLLEASLHNALVVFVGWFGAAKMRSLVFSPKLCTSMLLLYGCERKWLRSRLSNWCKELGHEVNEFGFVIPDESSQDSTIVEDETVDNQDIEPQVIGRLRSSFERRKRVREQTASRKLDELEVIEFALRGCADRIAVSREAAGEQVSVLRYELSGGYRAYFKPNHRVVCATSIVSGGDGELETIAAEELRVGDCIVDVSMSKDLIRSYADQILHREGELKQREIANKWREAIRAELAFSDVTYIANKLRSLGCKRSPEAIRHWLTDDEFIGPNSLQDLSAIAALTERTAGAYLAARVEDVHEAIMIVRAAHTAAGGELSRRMRSTVSEVIRRSGMEDPFTSGESVVIEDSEIGTIRLHQVIDAANAANVKISLVNKIISL